MLARAICPSTDRMRAPPASSVDSSRSPAREGGQQSCWRAPTAQSRESPFLGQPLAERADQRQATHSIFSLSGAGGGSVSDEGPGELDAT